MSSLREWRWCVAGIAALATALGIACGDQLPEADPSAIPPARDSGTIDDDGGAIGEGGPPAPPCTDITSQSEHCGACGRSCFGAPCTKGVCAPALLTNETITPLGIAVDDTHVYWTASGKPGAIERIAKATPGAGKPERFQQDIDASPLGVAVNATTVYWTTSGHLHLRPKDRSKEAATSEAPLVAQGIWWIFADDARVYVGAQSGPGLGVIRMNADYSTPVNVSGLSTIAFAVDNDVVYSAGASITALSMTNGNVSASTASTYDNVNWIALGPNDVWWTHRFGIAHVTRAGFAGFDGGALDAGAPNPGGMVYDPQRQHPYYVTSTHLMMLESPESPAIVASVPCSGTPGQLAQDDDALYWTCPNGNEVWRWTKPPIK